MYSRLTFQVCPADEGATALAHAITHNTTLVKLEIQRNGFSSEGALHIAQVDLFRV